jgi:replicative DNA helicase
MGEISEAPLSITATAAGSHVSTARAVLARSRVELLVLDDVSAVTSDELSELRRLAQAEQVCVVVALAHVSDPELEALESEAAAHADVVIRVDRDHARAGEADLVVVHHRRGPRKSITVAFEGHYGRFRDLDADEERQSDE